MCYDDARVDRHASIVESIEEKSMTSKRDLLKIIYSWKKMIENNGEQWPTACLDDLKHSIDYVLEKEGVIDDYE